MLLLEELPSVLLFFFNDTATTEIYTLSLHDALPICPADSEGAPRRSIPCGHILSIPALSGQVNRASGSLRRAGDRHPHLRARQAGWPRVLADRKSTRLNSSHDQISYAVFCLKKKTESDFTFAVDPRPPQLDPDVPLVVGYPSNHQAPIITQHYSDILLSPYYQELNAKYVITCQP